MGLAPPALASDAKQDAAESAAAMERAKRLAANPLRVILEASKVKRKIVADPEAAPSTASGSAAAVANAGAGATPAVSVSPTSLAVPLPAAFRADDAPPAARPLPPPMRTLSGAPMAATLASVVPAMQATDRLAIPDALAVARLSASAASAVVAPRLVDMVEPVIPPRVLEQIGATVEFNADLTIRPDGTVAQVSLVLPVNRTISRYVVAAMERWRFSPLPGEQIHRVQLVLNEGK